jgi:chromosome segregation ATPase
LITLYAAMLVTLGFLIAALIAVVVLPAYRRRIERFTTEALKRTLPLSEAEIRADKDRLRAEFAMQLHRLETKLEEADLAAARQKVELNRRDAKIQELMEAIADQKMSVEEHENARRVLEQAILDRLPKVEQRLAETRKLLAARDREIRTLVATSAKQAAALEEATQLNVQREKELKQLRTTLETRALRVRDAAGSERADSTVALKTELEALRAKAQDQAELIERLQQGSAKVAGPAEGDERTAEIKRLTTALAAAESELAALKASIGDEDAERMALEDRIAELQAASDAKSTELARLRAALKTYEETAPSTPGIAQKADLSALHAEVEEQRRTIIALRAEIAAAQERLSRQAQHFHEELRRVAPAATEEGQSDADGAMRKPLAERLAAPRGPRSSPATPAPAAESESDGAEPPREQRPAAYLRALNGGNGSMVAAEPTPSAPRSATQEDERPPPLPSATDDKTDHPPRPARRPRLLERISGLDKA